MRLEVEAGEDQAEESQAQSSLLEKSDAAEPCLELEFAKLGSDCVVYALFLLAGLSNATGAASDRFLGQVSQVIGWLMSASAAIMLVFVFIGRKRRIKFDRKGFSFFDGRRITEHLYGDVSPWKLKLPEQALRVVAFSGDLTPSDRASLPANDVLLRHLESQGVVTNSPWGTKKLDSPTPVGSIAWRQRGDSKWILVLPGIFLLTVAVYILREPALDDVLAWVLGGIGALWLAVWLSLAASQRGVKGLLEFKDQGLRVTARGQVLSEIDFADLKRFEIQTRTGSLGRREKRIVALTHYAREVPMTDWLTTWDSTGEFVISEALKRGLSIGFEGLRDQEALPDE